MLLPAVAGLFTGCLVFAFKSAATFAIEKCGELYAFARSSPLHLLIFFAVAAAAAVLAAIIARWTPSSTGGGIPTAVAILRGLITFKWLRNLISVFAASMMTFLIGVPLGNEGPSVQLGTSAGRAAACLGGKKFRAADRYVMTGGACAGFAVATGAPISGIFFALEETHRRFTPTLVISALAGVLAGCGASSLLGTLTNTDITSFTVPAQVPLSLSTAWCAVVCGLFAADANIALLMIYRLLQKLWRKMFKLPNFLKLMLVFVATAAVGLLLPDAIGTGHELIDLSDSGRLAWYMMLLLFAVRALLTMSGSVAGVTGGLFVPLIAFGALSGALGAKLTIASGLVDAQYYPALVLIGVAAFLGAALKTPVTAIIFTLEVFGGMSNAVYLALGTAVAFTLSEISGWPSINDTVIGHKLRSSHIGELKRSFDINLTVMSGSFAEGLEIRDILWPASCTVLRLESADGTSSHLLREGDSLFLHYETYDPDRITEELQDILGKQNVLEQCELE